MKSSKARSSKKARKNVKNNKNFFILVIFFLLGTGCISSARELPPVKLDNIPRLLVVTALEAERQKLTHDSVISDTYLINGRSYATGDLAGRAVVIGSSGVSMVNAAMNIQAILDRFIITGIIFSGIAGGVNPSLNIGDVVVPAQWGQYQEQLFARQKDDDWDTTWYSRQFGHYDMIFPQPVTVICPDCEPDKEEDKFWFAADAGMLKAAKDTAQKVTLESCVVGIICLSHEPKIVVGGNGVSGSTFVDNAAYREWVWETFKADALDMESAAVAQVAYVNHVPFIAFRSLSDLAGGGAGQNELLTFFQLAANNSATLVVEFLKAWQ